MTGKLKSTGQPKILGYRELTEAEIDLMNRIKAKAEEVNALVQEADNLAEATRLENSLLYTTAEPHRWAYEGSNLLQQGFMALTRSVAKPTSF